MQNKLNMVDSFEKIEVKIYPTAVEGSVYAAQQIASLIKQKASKGEMVVLGMATGSTPIKMYAELVRMHREEGLSFKNVITFNLDEYYPIDKDAYQSYWSFMHRNLFNHIDIDPKNIHLPNGNAPKAEMKNYCASYEQAIEAAGGIDLQILGIGQNGHIGFNEPGSSILSKTRLVNLENSTRLANSYEFETITKVPRLAVTMGISSILKAKKIILLAWGNKASIVAKSVEGNVTESIPASILQQHNDCTFIIDQAASTELTRIKSPWLTGDCVWTDAMIKRAVVNLALKLNKSVLSLTSLDYTENGLSDLLVEQDDAYEINLQVFYMLRDTITGWPGGKPNAVIPAHPERSEPHPKRCLIFSPHPDDDIISMGGTFMRLHDQGHEVHVAYQTSGNIAVTDEFVTRFIDFAVGFEEMFGMDNSKSIEQLSSAEQFISSKKKDQMDTREIRAVKGLIRRGEAKATCRYVGLPEGRWHFMNMPFYETGTIEKKPLGEEDILITMELLRKLKPHQVYCAGDLADPHGTHRVCLEAVFEALRRIKAAGDDWIKDCWVWLYKGAWQEWDIAEIEMAIPMSPDQVKKKRFGIFIHQSQKDMVPFQGADNREFWQRAEDRNANTANLYAALGMTKYAAMEAFVRWHY
ncbi:MAG: glucosamine-6-phosphate deaminase [Sphingobacteriia bacterium 24-36-13]|jgi:glucosamine-6-phosphate deaminase|uniref:glucosamine-6-phosphate deaminase n=1 Tax=Sediminibacterium sp. TaxID=1917865 RepID=UPI000BC6CB0E|nr:glucosamine-6-phosphate deaminase [Sediminibacterium sp.]OYY12159.1 MAG: glucosamine-6-phosphate deaminase [Sphingobacteriia bacterium 35-36-14]OYZ55665.1 MAG: glucosamine-6-phosphate deaminase [Sphingobacteriia bacterium 24-36-13]OZA65412.1 MAG: glucosamine-6-phosphate deaminase [Sphingobacteriia bacterium 39-36-14]HQS23261.1 glucosamine-6-phosphate deaminase [Sediminibacterium sp.]HQS34758.1 glucosamine-6-phosphate deaminase [Sediminibacterium sp.]